MIAAAIAALVATACGDDAPAIDASFAVDAAKAPAVDAQPPDSAPPPRPFDATPAPDAQPSPHPIDAAPPSPIDAAPPPPVDAAPPRPDAGWWTIGFGDCVNMDPEDACIDGEMCVTDYQPDPRVGVCARFGCEVDADCPTAPWGGTAPVRCIDMNADLIAEECALDCSRGQECPSLMECYAGWICVWPVE